MHGEARVGALSETSQLNSSLLSSPLLQRPLLCFSSAPFTSKGTLLNQLLSRVQRNLIASAEQFPEKSSNSPEFDRHRR